MFVSLYTCLGLCMHVCMCVYMQSIPDPSLCHTGNLLVTQFLLWILRWILWGHLRGSLGGCRGNIGEVLGSILGPCSLHVGSMLPPCWLLVVPHLGHLGPGSPRAPKSEKKIKFHASRAMIRKNSIGKKYGTRTWVCAPPKRECIFFFRKKLL